MDINQIMQEVNQYVAGTYTRKPEAFVRGRGSWLKSVRGNSVLDFFPGWGVSNLGHCHPRVVKAVSAQASRLIHLPNVFYIPDQGTVARRICRYAFPGKVFFANSGTESVECAIKAAKAWGRERGREEFISFERSFHGRTLGSVTLTGQARYRDPFVPLMPSVKYAEFNRIDSVRKLAGRKTAAVIIEPVQGEGGVRVADKEFIRELARLARQNDFLLIFDEVQTGFGRTGRFFAFEHFGIRPDILCMGKAIAGGIPMGATLLSSKIESVLQPGMHASTFGGNYIACAASRAVFETFEQEKILEKSRAVQKTLVRFFQKLASRYSQVREFRHLGMMFGLEMESHYAPLIADRALDEGLIINCTAKNVLRIMPALNLSHADCSRGIKILENIFRDVC